MAVRNISINDLDFLDMLTIFSVMLQIMGVCSDSKDLSNNDLMEELQNQDRKYLEKIIENQNKILDKLATLA